MLAVFVLGAAALEPLRAQAPAAAADPAETPTDWLRANYTKYEYKIAMRDGIKLFTAVYIPKDDAVAYPILLSRTPYSCGPYGVDVYPRPRSIMSKYMREKFIFVFQDVRGRYASEGTFVHMRPIKPHKQGDQDTDESTDAYDTIDWLVKNVPRNNGKVGMWGISYPGFYTAEGMIDSHPALKCATPQAPINDWFIGDDFHHNGALYLPHAFGWLSSFGQHVDDPLRQQPRPFDFKTPNGYEFYLQMGPLQNADKLYFHGKIDFWDDLMTHGTYDAYWQARNLRPHLKNIHAAVMTVGGWYDAEDLFGALHTFSSVEEYNPGISNMLVMGPWDHGGWGGTGDKLGNVSAFSKTGNYYRENIELPFFKHFLKDEGKFDLPKAYVFEGGTDVWRKFDAWPPKTAAKKTLYLQPRGRLSFDPPAKDAKPFDEYVSDPAKPVPFIPNIAIGMTREHMLDDQRFAASRPDVLVYETDALEEDVTLAGPVRAKLQVSTTGTDSDWVVKLIDVYSGDFPNPDPNPSGVQMGGFQQLVRGELMRGKFRNSYEKPEPFTPGKVTAVHWVLPDVFHTFRRGHRIMIQVQSSWFPLADRNPQKFCDIYHATEADFQKATERVYHAPDASSQVEVSILPPVFGAQRGK
ncbi:MAG TPA: CocE/NonD family hydrolase [Pirellulales bacterium]|nr:CocE/NonD family hydrolase [Pirellulales bacterium]